MHLSKLTLEHIRTYEKGQFVISPGVTLIVGPNSIGKTNIIESIYALATGKCFRAQKDSDMVQWGKQIGRIQAHFSDDGDTELTIVFTTGSVSGVPTQSKRYFVNRVARRYVDFIGNLRAVLFAPQDLALVNDSPSVRRSYLNSVLSQVDREYRRNVLSYEKGLRQRNKLLERIHDGLGERGQLIFWDQLLIKAGSYITDARERFIAAINACNPMGLPFYIEYDPSIISASRLAQYSEEEVAAKTTLVGPQRDDFTFKKKNGKNVKGDDTKDVGRFGSRGEQRLAVLWLKVVELEYIEQTTKKRPLLLLDDIFSELDNEGRALILSIIDRQQTVVTTAEDDVVELFAHLGDAKIIRLP